ncbi:MULTISPECIES: hypothetical protein [unclassified Lysinibacillus]|uniref:hypothetical protein n=1 Tax=unclassified Lysinibacillus TaxID=2636778 RepID=UPI002555778A|nr:MULTISPECIES: hypothetical protein [unclassified Lysinibacillus]MDM5250206.1 hypothetical protein [Lysinibacillus sp. G4S2]
MQEKGGISEISEIPLLAFIFSHFNFFQQMSFVAKAKRQLQKSPTSIGNEMNANLSYFSAGVQTPAERS